MSLDLNSRRVEEFLRPDGREFQTEGARKLKECSPNVLVLRFGTFRSFSVSHTMSEGFVLVHMHIESEKDNLAESRQKSGRQKWLSCTVVGISSEASAVYCCAPVAVRVLISGVQLWDFNARFQVLCCLCLPWNVHAFSTLGVQLSGVALIAKFCVFQVLYAF